MSNGALEAVGGSRESAGAPGVQFIPAIYLKVGAWILGVFLATFASFMGVMMVQIIGLSRDVGTLTGTVAEGMSAIRKDVLRIETSLGTLHREFGDLKNDFASVKRDFGDLKKVVETLQTDFAGMRRELADLKKAVAELRKEGGSGGGALPKGSEEKERDKR